MAKGKAMTTQEEAEIVTRKPTLLNQRFLCKNTSLRTGRKWHPQHIYGKLKENLKEARQYCTDPFYSYLLNACHRQSIMLYLLWDKRNISSCFESNFRVPKSDLRISLG